jgi:hypothetical protein
MDRRGLARWSLAALQVRCLGTAGGCIGMVIGALVGIWLATAATHNALALIPGGFIGAFVGLWAGMFIALRMMSR